MRSWLYELSIKVLIKKAITKEIKEINNLAIIQPKATEHTMVTSK